MAVTTSTNQIADVKFVMQMTYDEKREALIWLAEEHHETFVKLKQWVTLRRQDREPAH